jgi:hypothetical protein
MIYDQFDEDDEELDADHVLQLQAQEQSFNEAHSFAGYFRFYNWLTWLNRDHSVQLSRSASLTLTKEALRMMHIGFTDYQNSNVPKGVFFEFQPYHYAFLKSVGLNGAWLEDRGVTLVFNSVKYGDFLLRMIRIYIPIVNKQVLELIRQAKYVTLAEIQMDEDDSMVLDVTEVLSPPVPLLQQPPKSSKKNSKKRWSRAM